MNKTNKPQLKFVNCETGEETIRDATAEEIAQMELDATYAKARKAEAKAIETAKAALLTRLGITAEEAQLLLGGN
jgi:hypothetical protein